MKKLLLLLAAVAFAFTGCYENTGPDTPNVGDITLSQQTIDVEFEAATYFVSVTSPFSWEATSNNDWI